ncbi:DUF4382 domain-containing protein [Winogradskyella bathintestinalis]|uniref:DUF4382 domain-containing protein n=1 Tax=Winogradskyella bathintestinalis TaxID=3035208 RepID=A0ABT7ZQV5_9FLAO|nr:DUF4382 domain-containing protein [Winogradskyella bathintestinalis]MDN3491386.1 DUF4382 domain-containing protein [Winogradskyella bathintestinalis]
MKHLQSVKLLVVSFIILISFSSCSKEEMSIDGNKAALTVKLKSHSNSQHQVFLDIEDVQVKVKENDGLQPAWVSLNAVNIGTHNMSELTNQSELLLVEHFELNPTYIQEIRLVLGDNNFINSNEILIRLETEETATVSNLVKTDIEENHIYQVVININIDESVSFDATKNTMLLNPKLYTEIRKF